MKTGGEDLIGTASDRARRLIEDLSRDADDLRTASDRAVSDDDRREVEALLDNTIAAARRLHSVLTKSK